LVWKANSSPHIHTLTQVVVMSGITDSRIL